MTFHHSSQSLTLFYYSSFSKTKMFLMFTQLSLQSKQSAQLCNMTRVATRSRLEGGPNRFRLGSFSRAIILNFALLYNLAAFCWRRVSYQLEHQLISWSTITRAVTEESNGQHSEGVKQKGSNTINRFKLYLVPRVLKHHHCIVT